MTDCIRRVREWATCWLHCSTPRTTLNLMERSSLSLQFLQWEKRVQVGNQTPPALEIVLWKPLLWSCTTRISGESGAQSMKPDCDRELVMEVEAAGRGLATTSTEIFADWVLTYNAQAVIPTSVFAPLQNQVRVTFWPGYSVGADLSDMDPQMKSFVGSRAQIT